MLLLLPRYEMILIRDESAQQPLQPSRQSAKHTVLKTSLCLLKAVWKKVYLIPGCE